MTTAGIAPKLGENGDNLVREVNRDLLVELLHRHRERGGESILALGGQGGRLPEAHASRTHSGRAFAPTSRAFRERWHGAPSALI